MNVLKRIFFALAALISSALAGAYVVFRKQRRQQIETLNAGSIVTRTAVGAIEYADNGDGAAVLFSHGGGAGYDLGLLFTWENTGLRTISPSRPGYLRTPLETGPSPAEQADAFAALLDDLDIDRAAIIGTSGGGPPALEFAIRYPDRTWALVLISAITKPLQGFPPEMQFIERIMPSSDFLPWLFLNTPLVTLLAGKNARPVIENLPHPQARFERLMRCMFPLSLRMQGVFNDLRWNQVQDKFDFGEINAPTLVIHGDADTVVPFSHGELSARSIPGAQFRIVPGGNHLCYFTHLEELEPLVVNFLKQHAPR